MKSIFYCGLLSLWLFAFPILAFAEQAYFPNKAFSENPKSNEYWTRRYSHEPRSLKEPSLYEESKSAQNQSYRFLWLRTFHEPISVRLDIGADGVGRLTIKKALRKGTAIPGRVFETTARKLTLQQTNSFIDQISSLGFWTLIAQEDPVVGGPDGARWIIEGTKKGDYHTVDRWSPESGPVRTLGLALAIDLAQLTLPVKEIY